MVNKTFYLLITFILLLPFDLRGEISKEADLIKLRNNHKTNRAYEGAPPVVPHKLGEIGRINCLSCHKDGSALSGGKRSPITPHPDRMNCLQCHVEKKTNTQFIKNLFKRVDTSNKNRLNAPLMPPYIPHRMQDREQCTICHISETAEPVLKPRHGIRENCKQCHLRLQKKVNLFKP